MYPSISNGPSFSSRAARAHFTLYNFKESGGCYSSFYSALVNGGKFVHYAATTGGLYKLHYDYHSLDVCRGRIALRYYKSSIWVTGSSQSTSFSV